MRKTRIISHSSTKFKIKGGEMTDKKNILQRRKGKEEGHSQEGKMEQSFLMRKISLQGIHSSEIIF